MKIRRKRVQGDCCFAEKKKAQRRRGTLARHPCAFTPLPLPNKGGPPRSFYRRKRAAISTFSLPQAPQPGCSSCGHALVSRCACWLAP